VQAFAEYRRLDPRIFVLAAARAVNTMGFSIVMPFMAMYLVEKRGASGATYGAMYFVSGLCAALGNGLAGEASDRLGRRRVMLAALLLRAANMVLLGLAVTTGQPVVTLGLLIVVNGFLRSLFDPVASAAVTELCPASQRTAAFGLQRIGVNLGWALGPALGGTLAATFTYGTLFFAAAAGTVVAALAVSTVHDLGRPASAHAPVESLSVAGVRAAFQRNPAFFTYLALVLLGSIMTVQLFSTLSVFSKTELGLSEREIGLVYTVNGLLVVLLQVPAVTFIDAGGLGRALVFGPLLYTAAFVGIGMAESFGALAGCVALLTAGEVVFAPALSDMAAHLGDPKRLGRAFGLFGLMQQLGLSMGPLVGGTLYDHLRAHHLGMWGTIAAGMAATGVGYAAFARRHGFGWNQR
jgi:predicted MFS family arabinose efflux permease